MMTFDTPQETDSYCSVSFNAVIKKESTHEYVWLDETIKINPFIFEKLRNLEEDIKIFGALKECEKFIEEAKSINVILIVTLNYCRQMVENIHDLHHLQAINTYDNGEEDERLWTTNFPKIRYFTSIDDLIEKCFINPKLVTDCYESALFRLHSPEKTASSAKKRDILWLPSFLSTLNSIESDQNCKSQFIQACRQVYKNNKTNFKILDEFELTYRSDTVISWYTKSCFLYKLLNKVLREQNVEGLLLFHFFINDLHKQIKQMFYNGTTIEISYGYGKELTKNIIRKNDKYLSIERVYRGQIITKLELEELKKHDKKRLYFNSFLSATEYRNLALLFAGAGSYSVNSHYQSVVFEIEMNTKNNCHPRPYADISRFNEIENNEILFTLGSIFDITDINFDEIESTWFIKMEPASELTQQLLPINVFWSCFPTVAYPIDYETEWRLLEVGHLLQFRSNSHDKTTLSDIKLYYSLLRKYIPNSFSTAAAYVGIGILGFHQYYFTQSIKHLRKALKIYDQISPIKSFYSVQKLVLNIKVPLRYYRSILCRVHEYIIIICLLLRNSIKKINRWCIQLAKIGFGDEQQCSVGSYVSIVRHLKTLGYYESVSKLCASLKMSETVIMGTTLDLIVRGNGWNIMEAIMHVDIDDWYFYSKIKHNEQYFEYLSMTDRCDNAIQRVFHGTVIVCKYIADLYRKKQRMDLALTWYEMVITNIADEFVPMYYSIIAEGFNESNEKNRALEYYAKAVDYWRKVQCRKCEVLSFCDFDDASLMLFDMNRVIDEVIRLPQYPWSCLITYGVLRINNCDDIIAFHQNAYDSNDFLIKNREWLSILGSDYCVHASRIYVDTGDFNMAVHWCGKAFTLWPEQYRYRLIPSKIDIIPLLLSENLILLIQQWCKKQPQRLQCDNC